MCRISVLKTQWHLKERYTISVQKPRTTTAFAQRPMCTPAELLLHCRRPYCTAMVTLRQPHCALIRTPSDGVCFEHAQSACRRPAFYAIPQCLLVMPLHCCSDVCDRTARILAFCIFLGCQGITVRTLLWCDRGLILEDCNFNFRYVQLCDVDIPREKWLNYLQAMETLIRHRILRHQIWVYTICQLPF